MGGHPGFSLIVFILTLENDTRDSGGPCFWSGTSRAGLTSGRADDSCEKDGRRRQAHRVLSLHIFAACPQSLTIPSPSGGIGRWADRNIGCATPKAVRPRLGWLAGEIRPPFLEVSTGSARGDSSRKPNPQDIGKPRMWRHGRGRGSRIWIAHVARGSLAALFKGPLDISIPGFDGRTRINLAVACCCFLKIGAGAPWHATSFLDMRV